MIDNVVALYVDPRGPYPKLVREWYDEARDARTYAGPWPVVAHPPCGPWGRMRHLCSGDTSGLALDALEQVREYGGILEHPADSKLWEYNSTLSQHLGRFGCHVDRFGGRCIWLDQVEWGHVARKRTWLYMVRIPLQNVRPPYPNRRPTHWCRKQPGQVVSVKMCSKEQRRRTPPAFAEWLLALAARASKPSPGGDR